MFNNLNRWALRQGWKLVGLLERVDQRVLYWRARLRAWTAEMDARYEQRVKEQAERLRGRGGQS